MAGFVVGEKPVPSGTKESVVPGGTRSSTGILPSHEWLGYFQFKLSPWTITQPPNEPLAASWADSSRFGQKHRFPSFLPQTQLKLVINQSQYSESDIGFGKSEISFAASEIGFVKSKISSGKSNLRFGVSDISYGKTRFSFAKKEIGFAGNDIVSSATDISFAADNVRRGINNLFFAGFNLASVSCNYHQKPRHELLRVFRVFRG